MTVRGKVQPATTDTNRNWHLKFTCVHLASHRKGFMSTLLVNEKGAALVSLSRTCQMQLQSCICQQKHPEGLHVGHVGFGPAKLARTPLLIHICSHSLISTLAFPI